MLLYVYNLTFESIAAFEASKPDPQGEGKPLASGRGVHSQKFIFYFFAPSHHRLTTGAFSH